LGTQRDNGDRHQAGVYRDRAFATVLVVRRRDTRLRLVGLAALVVLKS